MFLRSSVEKTRKKWREGDACPCPGLGLLCSTRWLTNLGPPSPPPWAASPDHPCKHGYQPPAASIAPQLYAAPEGPSFLAGGASASWWACWQQPRAGIASGTECKLPQTSLPHRSPGIWTRTSPSGGRHLPPIHAHIHTGQSPRPGPPNPIYLYPGTRAAPTTLPVCRPHTHARTRVCVYACTCTWCPLLLQAPSSSLQAEMLPVCKGMPSVSHIFLLQKGKSAFFSFLKGKTQIPVHQIPAVTPSA